MMIIKYVLIFLLFMAPAFASDLAIDFTQPIVDQDGRPLAVCLDPETVSADSKECLRSVSVTLGFAAFRALTLREPNLAPDESYKRGALGLDIYQSRNAVLTAEQIALIKAQIAKAFTPLIVVRAFRMLDPAQK